MRQNMTLVKVISGIYVGRIGWATKVNRVGNVMFYPLEGQYPYRVCLSQTSISKL